MSAETPAPGREPFRTLRSKTVVLRAVNIDTDQIMPARFLTTTSRDGLGRLAFHDWRFDAAGEAIADCMLNRVDPATHRILLAGHNFGCGSSREHAPWALMDFGFRAVVSTGIADIFSSNALKNGLLPIVVDEAVWADLAARPESTTIIDLEACELTPEGRAPVPFQIEPFARRCLLEGLDAFDWLLARVPEIAAYEHLHPGEA